MLNLRDDTIEINISNSNKKEHDKLMNIYQAVVRDRRVGPGPGPGRVRVQKCSIDRVRVQIF
jgi:hypothetical protein